jgi:hypothetical protein
MKEAGMIRTGALAVAVAVLAVATGVAAGRATAGANVYCGDGAADQALLQNAINGGGTVSVHGHCLGNWQIANPVTLSGVAGAILDGGHVARVLAVQAGVTATINSLTIENGSASMDNFEQGGGIEAFDGSTVNVNGSTITGNSAWSGGGIGVGLTSTVNVTGSTISRNSAAGGGGIDVAVASLTVTNSSVVSNSAIYLGAGGISGYASTIDLIGSHVSWNTAALQGGGAVLQQGQMTLTNTTVDHNTAQGAGGILNLSFNGDSQLTLKSSTIAFNRDVGGLGAGYGGGGISNFVFNFVCYECTAAFTATDSKIYGNLATASVGGGIYNFSTPWGNSAVVTLRNTTVSSGPGFLNPNKALYGGGIYNAGHATPGDTVGGFVSLLAGSAVVRNLALVDGGGIYNTGGGTIVRAGGVVMLNNPNNCVGC